MLYNRATSAPDPGFNATVTNHLDKLIAYVNKICTDKLDSTWHFSQAACFILRPGLPEDLAYKTRLCNMAPLMGLGSEI